MKANRLIALSISLALAAASPAFSQTTGKSKPASPSAPLLKFCHIPNDSSASSKLFLPQAQEWADQLPLQVVCNNGQKYSLNQFQVTIITMNPLQSKEYGLANGGFPIMARRAIDAMKPGDSIFLKDVMSKDSKGSEIKLPNLVLSIKEQAAAPADTEQK